MKVLLWHWGRRGAGPRFAMLLHRAFGLLPRTRSILSLPAEAEILASGTQECTWPYTTYSSAAGALARLAGAPFAGRQIRKTLDRLAPDVALCVMPAVLDRLMIGQLRVPYGVIVHDAVAHPGEWLPFRIVNQARLLRGAGLLVTLSQSVADLLRQAGFPRPGQHLLVLAHPPMPVGAAHWTPPFAHGGPPRLLMFGRLQAYKGLDLLCEAMEQIGPNPGFTLTIAGQGPASSELARLRAMPHVRLDLRWIPEEDVGHLINKADAVVLPYRQASQSGVAAAALAQGRHVIATNVGGLAEQLRGVPHATLCAPDARALAAAMTEFCAKGQDGQSAPPADPMAGWVEMAAQLRAGLELLVRDPQHPGNPSKMINKESVYGTV